MCHESRPAYLSYILRFSRIAAFGSTTKGVTERLYRADASQNSILENSPIKRAYEGSSVRCRLTTPPEATEFPILKELRRAGITDYIVLPVPFSDGTNKALSLATMRASGFSNVVRTDGAPVPLCRKSFMVLRCTSAT